MIGLIWAQDAGGVIGADGGIPWRLPEDQARFKELTLGATVVMGRHTWESLPKSVRPLPGRTNIVLTRDPDWHARGVVRAADLEQALAAASGDVWVMGGQAVYRAALARADRLEVTEVDLRVHGDARAPEIPRGWRADAVVPDTGWSTSRTGLRYRFVSYVRADGDRAGRPQDLL